MDTWCKFHVYTVFTQRQGNRVYSLNTEFFKHVSTILTPYIGGVYWIHGVSVPYTWCIQYGNLPMALRCIANVYVV